MRVCRGFRAAPILLLAFACAACGKKGPPLAPLRIVPDAPGALTAARLGSTVNLRFTIPSANAAGAPGPVDIDRMEIYAASVAPGAEPPPNREFLAAKYLVGTVPVKPAPVPGAPEPEKPVADARPGAGEAATFSEVLTPELLDPPASATPPKPVVAFTRGQVPSVPVSTDWWMPNVPTRIYATRAITRRGVGGNPSARLTIPLAPPPPAPAELKVTYTKADVVVTWAPPARDFASAVLFNVYRADAPAGPPLTPSPIGTPTFTRPGVTYGVEECFTVRSVAPVAGAAAVTIESEPAATACATPRDVFAPAPPTGFDAVSSGGVVSLIWDASPEPDIAGYMVLRAEAPGDTLQPITARPITDTVYRDTTVTPGIRYVYAIIAVDNATPPNASAQSARKEVTAAQ